jgi:hypothetical protein
MTLLEVVLSTALAAGVVTAASGLLSGGREIAGEQARLTIYTTTVPALRSVASRFIEQALNTRVYDGEANAQVGAATGVGETGPVIRLDYTGGTSATICFRAATGSIPEALWYRNASGKEWVITYGTGSFTFDQGVLKIVFYRAGLINVTIMASAH